MFRKINPLILLPVIIFLGVVLRMYHLTAYPPSLNWDEVSHAYNAYSLLKTGRDQWGQAFPLLNYRAYGDYPTVLDTYLTVPSIFIFGPVDFAVRFPHALAGVIICLLGFVCAYYFFRKPGPALLMAVFLAVDPWSFFQSRAVFQSNFAVLFLFLGLAFYLAKKPFGAVFMWAISLFAYHNTRIFIPLLLLFLLPRFKSRVRLVASSVLVIIFSLGILFMPGATARNSWLEILDSGAIARIGELRSSSDWPVFLRRIVYNRPTYFVTTVIKHYFQYFSPQFLFLQGGSQYQYSVPGFGVLNWAELPFFYFGIFLLFKRRDKLPLAWLLLAPLPAVITRDEFAVIRSTTMLPAVILTVTLGFYTFWKYIHGLGRWALTLGFVGVYTAFSWFYFNNYLYIYPQVYSSSWQFGYHQLVNYLRFIEARYDRVIITKKYGEPHEFILWYLPVNPATFRTDKSLVWDYHADWYWVNGFSKYVFINDWELPAYVSRLPHSQSYLIVASPDNIPAEGKEIYRINFLDKSPAFILKQI